MADQRSETQADGQPTRIAARDPEDLSVMSAMLQDALVPVRDLRHLRDERRFVAVVNRFRWENAAQVKAARGYYERTLSGLAINAVSAVRRRGIDLDKPDELLNLLTVGYLTPEEGGPALILGFSHGRAIRVEVDSLSCILEDFGDPWPTQWRPGHGPEGDGA